MKLSTRARYALRMLLEIAKQPEGATMSLGVIAENTDISRRYLDQLAIALRSAALVRSSAGRGGGYRLARTAQEITLAEIIEASIGPISIVDCVVNPEACDLSKDCQPRKVYALINRKINEVLQNISLAELTDPRELQDIVDDYDDCPQRQPSTAS